MRPFVQELEARLDKKQTIYAGVNARAADLLETTPAEWFMSLVTKHFVTLMVSLENNNISKDQLDELTIDIAAYMCRINEEVTACLSK